MGKGILSLFLCGLLMSAIAGCQGSSEDPAIPVPTGLTVVLSGTTACLDWDFVSGSSSYKGYRSDTEDGSYSLVTTVYGTAHNERARGAYYKISAVVDGKESAQSEAASAFSSDLVAPSEFSAKKESSYNTLTWSSVTGASYYIIYRSENPEGPYVCISYEYYNT